MIEVFYCRDERGYDPRLPSHVDGCGPYPTAAEAEAAMLARISDGVPEVTTADATDAILAWQREAGEAGDHAMVETCERTMDGDAEALAAWCRCEREADASHSL